MVSTTRRIVYVKQGVHRTYKKCCQGFVKISGKCIPNCDHACENGKCIGNNVCECTKGYKILSPSRCIPECSNCEHGNCIGPEKCDCYHGYEKSDNETCVLQCDPPCVNAECISENKCKCNGNFKFINNTHCVSENFILKRDMCVKACNNGDCDESNQCICSKGYESHMGNCKMICDKKCINGRCLNDQCTCDDNFIKFNSTNCVTKEFIIQRDSCEIICENGKCNDSNECLCNKGFKFNREQNKCEPICTFEDSEECINGKCVAPNKCECLAGYELDTDTEYQCNPVCKDCTNGFCKKPGVCQCNKGFILEKTGCVEENVQEIEILESTTDSLLQPTTHIIDDKISTATNSRKKIDPKFDEIASTLSSFVSIPSTEVMQSYATDNLYENFPMFDRTTDNYFDVLENTSETMITKTSTMDESSATTENTFEHNYDDYKSTSLSSIDINASDKVVIKLEELTTPNDASFEDNSTFTKNVKANDSEKDNFSLSTTIPTETFETQDTTDQNEIYLNTKQLYVETSTQNEIEIQNTSEKYYTENIILDTSSSTMEALTTLNDLSDITTTFTLNHTASTYNFYDENASTNYDTTAFNLEYSESTINFEIIINDSAFNIGKIINTKITSIGQESSTNINNIHIADKENSSNKNSKLNLITTKDKPKLPLNLCEKPCDDGSCAIDGNCHKESSTLTCSCINGTCYENVCICNRGFIVSSEDNFLCIKEVQV